MAGLKIEINKDTNEARFDSLYYGDVFIIHGEAHIKVNCCFSQVNAVELSSGLAKGIDDDVLVTRVKKAELEIRT